MSHRIEHLAEGVTLHLGDCREILPTLGRVQAVVTDPPYGVLAETWDDMTRRELARFTMSWVGIAAQMSDRAAIFFGEKTRSVVSPLLELAFEDVRQIIWSKQGGVIAEDRMFYSFESIFYCHKDEVTQIVGPKGLATAGLITEARTAAGLSKGAVDVAVRGKKTGLCYRWEEAACIPTAEQAAVLKAIMPLDGRFDAAIASARAERDETLAAMSDLSKSRAARLLDVLTFPTPSERYHPTQKPVELMGSILSFASEPDDLICDPFTGSGSTAVACVKHGRRFVGVEQDQKYFDIACKRVAEELARPTFFAQRRSSLFQEALL